MTTVKCNELEEFYKRFNNTKSEYPKDKTIIDLFLEQVYRTPNANAVLYKGEAITYKELDIKSNQVVSLLKSKQVGPNDIIGITLERSFEMIIGLYGILKSGAAYLPILPDTPISRIEYIVKDSKMRCLLTQNKFVNQLRTLDVEIVDLDKSEIYSVHESILLSKPKPHDLIYVIYTSGSTGQPKGVMIEHFSVVNRLNWMQKNYPIGSEDTILQKTPFAFDVSVWELFWWAMTGARVCMLEAGYEKFSQTMINEIHRSKVTTMHFVPSMLSVFLNYIESGEDLDQLTSLKRVFCSGETLLPAHVKKFNRCFGEKISIDLVNLYGPTEATVDITYYNCPKDIEVSVVPIGKPIDNIRLYVFNNGKLQGPGSEGELFVAGDGLARGYLNKEELTNEKYSLNSAIFGERLYCTGDYVRISDEENIEYIGRIDHQVKLRGLRIELGEIESCINEFENIDQCVVIVKNQETVNPILVAYMLFSTEVDIKELKTYLKNRLPSYMVPNNYVAIDEFPLNQNGKIDRNALRKLLADRPASYINRKT